MKTKIILFVLFFGFSSFLFGVDTVGTAQIGQKVTFSLTVGKGTPPFTYQWSKSGSPISGATSATFVIPAVSAADAGTYTCSVSNSAGNTVSNNAVFTVALVPPSNVIIIFSSE